MQSRGSLCTGTVLIALITASCGRLTGHDASIGHDGRGVDRATVSRRERGSALAERLASADVFAVEPSGAQQYFERIVDFRSSERGDDSWEFVGPGTAPDVRSGTVEFDRDSADANAKWHLRSVRIFLTTSRGDGRALFDELKGDIQTRLGAPEWTSGAAGAREVVWRVEGDRIVTLMEGPYEEPLHRAREQFVVIGAGVEQDGEE